MAVSSLEDNINVELIDVYGDNDDKERERLWNNIVDVVNNMSSPSF